MISGLRNWIYKVIDAFIKMDAKLTTKEHKEARLSECEGCEFKTKMRVKPILPLMDACTACGGCVLETKANMITHMRDKLKKEGKLTPDEVADYALNRKIQPERFEEVLIKCPENKWVEIDKQHLK